MIVRITECTAPLFHPSYNSFALVWKALKRFLIDEQGLASTI